MKYVITLSCALALAFSFVSADAATISVTELPSSSRPFGLDVSDIARDDVSQDVRFGFKPTAVQNQAQIAYWKVRVYCEDQIMVGVNATSTNSCGKAVRIENAQIYNSALWFQNMTNETKRFSFKLKAYDINGKWIHTESRGFHWK